MKQKEPDWVSVLRKQCSQSSQKRVGVQINYSNAVVNQILKGSYKGDISRVESAVKGAFSGRYRYAYLPKLPETEVFFH